MSSKSASVYIFSFVPKLYEEIIRLLPNHVVKHVAITANISGKYEKNILEEELAQLQDAKILLSDGHLIAQIYNKLPHLEWIHCTWAGVEGLVDSVRSSPSPPFPITRFTSNNFSQLIAEYVIAWIINCERGLLKTHDYQRKGEWAHKDNIATYRSLSDLSVGVMGVGQMGSRVIKALKFFQCKIHTLGRSGTLSEGLAVDKHWATSDLSKFLQDVDYIINVLPSTDETKNLLGMDILKHAKKFPILINVGRGSIIKEEEIIMALDEGWLSAAVLDVFEEEPLRPESPLWTHPKVFLTPHCAAVSRAQDVARSFADNLELFLDGEELPFQIDWKKGY